MSWKHEEPLEDEAADGLAHHANPVENGSHEVEEASIRNIFGRPVTNLSESGISPAKSSKHEEPLEDETADGLAPHANPVENGSHEVDEAPLINIFSGRPVTSLLEGGIFIRNPPVESNHGQASGVMNTSQQGPPSDIDSAGLENGDAQNPPSAPNSPGPRTGKRVPRPVIGQALRPSRRKQSKKDEQPQPVASASLGPVHPSKVSKAAGKRKPVRQRRLNISQEISPGGLPLPSAMDAAEPQPPPDHVTPRRSKRVQRRVLSTAKDPARTASTDPSKRAVQSKPERKIASNRTTRSPAKPQGVSKRQPAKTTRGRVGGK
ncbi:hypothetical protein CC80DRAFT_562800 [Byssothecium circinans]|uniref:Uncharacterized protein n=1 Tax=Byssothecium circinans TaxID=147558 RepID=A0A6A5TU45_9PLEO|nr:hypothetical protein CC80DRAFT_562800 [Byssothecium circinans]